MKTRLIAAAFTAFLLAPAALFAQQVPIATKPSNVTSAASGVIMHPGYAKAIGRISQKTTAHLNLSLSRLPAGDFKLVK